MQTEQINELATALSKAQGAIAGATKDTENPHFKSMYADLGAVWDACRAPLSANGLSITQPIRHREGASYIVTRVTHTSGQWMEDDGMPLLLGKQDMQGLGSACTYARRYGLMAMVGIAPEDDDGNAAAKDGPAPKTTPKAAKQQPVGKAPDLNTRYKAFSQTLDLCKTAAELEKTWKRGDELLDELHINDPEKYNALRDVYDLIKNRFGGDPFTDEQKAA